MGWDANTRESAITCQKTFFTAVFLDSEFFLRCDISLDNFWSDYKRLVWWDKLKYDWIHINMSGNVYRSRVPGQWDIWDMNSVSIFLIRSHVYYSWILRTSSLLRSASLFLCHKISLLTCMSNYRLSPDKALLLRQYFNLFWNINDVAAYIWSR
jgi:hypothetical protein